MSRPVATPASLRGVGGQLVGTIGEVVVQAPTPPPVFGLEPALTLGQQQVAIQQALLILPPLARKPAGWTRPVGEEVEEPALEPGPAFTAQEANQLAGLTLRDGSPLFKVSEPDLFYQLVVLVLTMRDGRFAIHYLPTDMHLVEEGVQQGQGFDRVMTYLSSQPWIIGEETVHESPLMKEIRYQVDLAILEEEVEPIVEEGNIVCPKPKCGSRRILRNFAQTRSADEGTTVFLLCTECGKHWRKN